MTTYKTVAESNNFIVLDKYTKEWQVNESFQSEADLERELIEDLSNQGYEYLPALTTPDAMMANVRKQLQTLNKVVFTDAEWARFCEQYLNTPSDNILDKTRKVHSDYIFDFVFDDGHIENIYLFDKKTIARNKVQVIKQFEQTGSHANRYDVTILVNGLPLVQIELKKRGVAIREAFNQIHRYSKESFNAENSLYKFLQLFVISNGTDTRYFANTTKRDKNSFDFTMNWAKSDNTLIKDLKDFTATFFQKETLLEVILRYSVFDVSNTLLVMRPYQIAATERILWKIKSAFNSRDWAKPESGGYIWHTTGSGKTLTSFKAARLATELDCIDKVFFVVDRKDLDFQTMKEYQRFSPDSVNGSDSTAGLKSNLDKDDNKIVVTTIQKLNNLIKGESDLAIYHKQVVFIFDECHRSQFGEAQKNLTKKFKKYYQFGFTGTPIFPENALGAETTGDVFGQQLHTYVITDAITDYNALFKSNYGVDSHGFQNYYRDLAQRVKNQEIDLLIVVGMFLTGFDAPTLNTLFVDKNLRYHGLMQAFSRTNRIYDATKTFGNIVTFRDLEQATIDAITLFGDKNTKNVVLEKSYKEYMEGFNDIATGQARRGFVDIVKELQERFPTPENIEKEQDKKDFAKLFGDYLKAENILQNYDEFAGLKALQSLDTNDEQAVEAFKSKYYLNDTDMEAMQSIDMPSERAIQDYRSTYNDTRDWLRRDKEGQDKDKSTLDWDDVVFEIDLLKSQEINLDYILELIFDHNKQNNSKEGLIEEVRRMIRGSLGNRAKESLVVDFIKQTNLDEINDKASIIDAFFTFAQAEQKREAETIIASEKLNIDAAKRYIASSLKREYASENGTALNEALPKLSPLNPQYRTQKQTVFQKIAAFVEKFKGVGGQI